MKSILKRAMCVGFALCLAASLIACGGNDNTESDTASSTKSSKTVSVIDTIDVPSGSIYDDPNWSPYSSMPDSIKGSTVRYATWIDHTQTEGAVPLANIENDIGIKAELYLVPQVGYVNTIMTKMASGDIPDVFKSNEVTQSFPLTLQIAAPINKVSSVDLNDPRWDKTLLDTATIDGNVYLVNALGSPWTGSNLLYFNKSVFEENGFNMNEVIQKIAFLVDSGWESSWVSGASLENTYTGKYIKNDPLCEFLRDVEHEIGEKRVTNYRVSKFGKGFEGSGAGTGIV